jgi:hypothetical protein
LASGFLSLVSGREACMEEPITACLPVVAFSSKKKFDFLSELIMPHRFYQ